MTSVSTASSTATTSRSESTPTETKSTPTETKSTPTETTSRSEPDRTQTRATKQTAADARARAAADGAARREQVRTDAVDPSLVSGDVRAHLGGLEPTTRRRTESVLSDALTGPNADRALETYETLVQMDGLDERERRALTAGVATPRSDSERGQAGVLSVSDAVTAGETLTSLSSEQRAEVGGWLDAAGRPNNRRAQGASPVTEQALIMKAVGARQTAFNPHVGAADGAMAEVGAFAKDIRGVSREELVRTTTLTDVHDKNTVRTDPTRPWIGANDDRGDNDALPQAFLQSCAPTAGQIVRGENDPAYARSVHREGFEAASADQSAILEKERSYVDGNEVRGFGVPEGAEKHAGLAQDRAPRDTLNGRYGPDILALHADGKLEPGDVDTLRSYVEGDNVEAPEIDGLMGRLHQQGVDMPRSLLDELRVQGETARTHGGRSGMTTESALSDTNGRPYRQVPRGSMPDAELVDALAAEVETSGRAAMGFDVDGRPTGHAVVATDVRADGQGRRFLMTDPTTARTAWVHERELFGGAALSAFGSEAPYELGDVVRSY